MGRPLEYDREGNPISLDEFCKLREDREYIVVQQDHIDNWLVSTVWLGVDYQFGDGPPIIFETKIFDQSQQGLQEAAESYERGRKAAMESFGIEMAKLNPDQIGLGPEAFTNRYSTEAEAKAGHEEALVAVRAGLVRREVDIEGAEVTEDDPVEHDDA